MPRPVSNPPNRFERVAVVWDGAPPPAELEVYEERARTALSKNDSPDVGFTWSVNPYRGCFHACAYCYARPTHAYWGFGTGTDFDRRLIVKVNIAERLRAELTAPAWRGDTIVFSGNTDCYQPLEARYELTRRCLEVCLEHRNPVALVTKGKLVRRDVDLLARLAREARVRVASSIPFADDSAARRLEPQASAPSTRFETLRQLATAGIPTAVGVAPVIPGLNDADIPTILERARDAGARSAFMILLRLPLEVLPVFVERLREAYPLRADKVLAALRDTRGGRTYDPAFGRRMRGQGPRWDVIEATFELHRRRFGLDRLSGAGQDAEPTTYRRPEQQLPLL